MAITPHDSTGTGPARPSLAVVLARVAECRDALATVHECVSLTGRDEVEELLTEIGRLLLMGEAAEVAIVSDAMTRGLPGSGPVALTATDWVAALSPRHTARTASTVVKLAEAVAPATVTRAAGPLAAGQPGEALGVAVLTGQASVAAATLAHAEMRRLAPDLQPDTLDTVWGVYADYACGGDPREIRAIRPELYARFGRPDRLDDRDERARAHRAFSTGTPDPVDGLTEYRLRLDPAGAAIIEAALDPLTKPVPGPDGEADTRSYVTRRADALLDLVSRAVRAGDTVPAQPGTQLSVIVKLADLQTSSGGGQPSGCGQAIGGVDAGRYLALATTRTLSCGADIAPIVVDDAGNPVLIGRTKRLFTRAQIRALHVRDGGCSYPRCSKPAGWTDAHHLKHWIDGGPTDLANAALLCSYHHHIVHTRRLAGHLTTKPPPGREKDCVATENGVDTDDGGAHPTRARVEWDLTPGSYDHAPPAHLTH